jgi:uncharacterized protein YecT (DUF1311 family)
MAPQGAHVIMRLAAPYRRVPLTANVMQHRAAAILFATALGCIPTLALALDRCSGAPQLAECEQAAVAKAEAALAKVYDRLISKADAATNADGKSVSLRRELERSQETWRAYRDAQCEVEAKAAMLENPNRGVVGELARSACEHRSAQSRRSVLMALEREHFGK